MPRLHLYSFLNLTAWETLEATNSPAFSQCSRFCFPEGQADGGSGVAIDRGLSKGLLQILGLLLKMMNAPNH